MTAPGRLADKVAIVTGAASGIGLATARAFLRAGARVAASDLDAPDLAALGLDPDSTLGLAHDVGEEADWGEVVAATLSRFGRLDILVNNAGVGGVGPLLDTSLADWRAVMRVNLDGVFLGTRAAVRAMQAAERTSTGTVVNVSSVLGLVGAAAGVAAYSASKGAVRLFSKSVALECAALGWTIRVNSVHPGYIATPLLERRLRQRAEAEGLAVGDLVRGLEAKHPIGRLGTAEDVAAAILYLASDEAAFVTGAELVIDGGYTAQ